MVALTENKIKVYKNPPLRKWHRIVYDDDRTQKTKVDRVFIIKHDRIPRIKNYNKL